MTVDQFKKDVSLVAQNVQDLASSLAAVGNTISILEATNIFSMIPIIRYNLDRCEQDTKDVSDVSDSDAEHVLAIIKGIVPNIAKASELIIQKKDVAAQLPNAFSIEGLFTVPAVVGGTIIRLISTQIDGLHGRVMALASIMIQLSPPKYKEEATSIRAHIDSLFQQALKAYSS